MAVLFVTFIPNEDEETQLELSSGPQGALPNNINQNNNGRTPVTSEVIDQHHIVISPAEDCDGANKVDDCSVSAPLLIKPQSMRDLSKISTFGPDSRRTSESNLLKCNVGNQDKPTISNSSSIQGSQLLEMKQVKRFQIVPATTDHPQGTNVDPQGDKSDKDNVDGDMVVERLTLKEAVHEILTLLTISNEIWELTESRDQWRLEFVVDSNKSEQVLHRLIKFGIGRIPETSVSLFPANVHYEKREDSASNPNEKKKKSDFMQSIKSRLTVTQVVMAVQSNARLTFDFLTLIVLASIIAGLGLAESSSVVLVASMLISPLMGPIIGFTFGIVIRNTSLWKVSVRNELIGLTVCLSYGFLFGLITGGINNSGANWGSSDSWPTAEMQARGMLRSLWVGVLIALPSGAGVALSILGGNTGSLVGVAISASLLPPAVNAGMLWGLAFVTAIKHPLYQDSIMSASNTSLGTCVLANNNYKFVYSCDMPTEAAILGSVSLLLTILNIICIFFSAIFVLKLKEVAPHTALSEETEAFWKRDIRVMRDTYRTVKGTARMGLAKQAKLLKIEIENAAKNNADLIPMMQNDLGIINVTSRLPSHGGVDFLNELSDKTADERQLLEDLTEGEPLIYNRYHTINNPKQAQQFLSRCTSHMSPTEKTSPFSATRGVGSVLRMRQPRSVSSDDDGCVVVDVELLSNRHKCRPKSAYHHTTSFDSATPTTTRPKSDADQV